MILEAINARTYGTNDLIKAKGGIEFEGINIISDREGLIDKAIKKVYPQVFGKQQISIKEYTQKLKNIPKEEIPNNLEMKLQSFAETMKENNILGNESVQALRVFQLYGFFGENLENAFLGKEEIVDNKKSIYLKNRKGEKVCLFQQM